MFFLSPLEHFQVYPLISIYFLNYDYSITNETIILLLFLVLISIYFLSFLKNSENSLYIVPNNRWQILNELLFVELLSVISENIIGLVPFSFALTGHLIVTMFISLSVFFAINIIGYRIHGLKIFSLFLPSGTCSPLYFLIVLIEFIFHFLGLLVYLSGFLLMSLQALY